MALSDESSQADDPHVWQHIFLAASWEQKPLLWASAQDFACPSESLYTAESDSSLQPGCAPLHDLQHIAPMLLHMFFALTSAHEYTPSRPPVAFTKLSMSSHILGMLEPDDEPDGRAQASI